MKQTVVLSIRGRQTYADQEPEVIELVTEGTMELKQGGWDISYEESALTGLEGVTTTFRVEPGKVTLSRKGALNSQMVFQEGRQHSSLYRTPYGTLDVDIRTGRIRSSINELGGVMEIDYDIAVQKQLMSKNRFQIRVKRNNLRQEI